jgi:hypothetical protein
MSIRQPDIFVEMRRTMGDGWPMWDVHVEIGDVAYDNADYEHEPDALLNWLKTAVAIGMGRVAAEQEDTR